MTTNEIMVKMVFDRWCQLTKRCTDLINAIPEEHLSGDIVPGKNRGVYLLGHLVAVHDAMLPLLDFGQPLYPELFDIFIKSPDKSVAEIPSIVELKEKWSQLDTFLTEKINSLSPEEWFARHTSVSAEDFEKEPHRNKLNILLTRTTHLSYHVGQLVLIPQ